MPLQAADFLEALHQRMMCFPPLAGYSHSVEVRTAAWLAAFRPARTVAAAGFPSALPVD